MSRQSANEDWWDRHLPSTVSKYLPRNITIPGDIRVIAGYLVMADLLLYFLPAGAVFPRALIGLPLLFFVPGYVLIAALFPGQVPTEMAPRTSATDGEQTQTGSRSIDWRDRLALSFGSSVALLPLLGLVISITGLDYNTVTIVAATSFVSALGLVPAVVYRSREPPADRLKVPFDSWAATVKNGFVRQDSRTTAVNVTVAALVLLSVAGVGYAMVAPNNAESFTSVSLLTENEQGELVAADYPETINGTGAELTLELENDEGTTTDYTVVAEIQRVQTDGTTTRVLEREEVTQMNPEIESGETWTRQHTVQPELTGENLRLIYYVYEGDAPAEPSTETAYRHVNIWVDVPPSSG